MDSNLQELERLAKREGAVVTVICGHGGIRASWKAPGKRAEKIASRGENIISGQRFPPDSVDDVLRVLLERLGWQGVPTCERFVDRMTPQQRGRVYELITEMRAIRNTVLGHLAEPRHASPRSSLHPQHWQGEEGDE
jgi:hypothetical protein